MNQLGKNPPKPDTMDMLWGVQNIVWSLCSYAKHNGPNLKIDVIAIKIILGGGNVFQHQHTVFDPQRNQMQSITEYYKHY